MVTDQLAAVVALIGRFRRDGQVLAVLGDVAERVDHVQVVHLCVWVPLAQRRRQVIAGGVNEGEVESDGRLVFRIAPGIARVPLDRQVGRKTWDVDLLDVGAREDEERLRGGTRLAESIHTSLHGSV